MADQTQTPQTPPGAPPGEGGLKLGDLEAGEGNGGGALLQQADAPEDAPNAHELDAIYNIPVQLSAVLGKTTMQVSQLLKLGRGAVVELDRKVGEAIDIYVNNRLVARGEVVVVEERLGITMTEIIKGHEQVS
jgi:flagellar motor switch protein FliN/FliY